MANTGDAYILNGVLFARGRGRGRGLCPLVKQLPNDAAPVIIDDFLFSADAGGSAGPVNLKTFDGLATASVKVFDGLAMASMKTFNGVV